MVSQIQSIRPVQKATKPKANPSSPGRYRARLIGKPDYWNCYYTDGDWFFQGKMVKIVDWK